MKTRKFLVYGLIAFAVVAVSCNKDDDSKDEFSPLTVEQNKENIETDGINLLNEIKNLEDEPAIEASNSFVDFMNTSSAFKVANISNSIAFAPIYALANFDDTGMKGILKSVQVNPGKDPETIQAVYDSLVGIYNWNPAISDWDYTQTGTTIVLNFPATETGTSNNASYTVSYVGFIPTTNPIEDYEGDLPQNIATSLKVDGVEISSFIADVVYESDGIPTSIETTFTLGTFVWDAMASNNNNAAFATEVSFKHSGTVILKFTLDASGDWSESNIDANYEVVYYGEWMDADGNWHYEEIMESEIDNYDYYWTEDQFDIHKVIKNGNASFQAMNMKIVGGIDVENFGSAMIDIDDTYNWETQREMIIDAQAEAINKYISLSLRYADSDEIIALVEAYPAWIEETYTSYDYDDNGNYYEYEETDTYYDIDMRFVFADGSKVDAETYFSEGFDDLIDEVDAYLMELEETYGK